MVPPQGPRGRPGSHQPIGNWRPQVFDDLTKSEKVVSNFSGLRAQWDWEERLSLQGDQVQFFVENQKLKHLKYPTPGVNMSTRWFSSIGWNTWLEAVTGARHRKRATYPSNYLTMVKSRRGNEGVQRCLDTIKTLVEKVFLKNVLSQKSHNKQVQDCN